METLSLTPYYSKQTPALVHVVKFQVIEVFIINFSSTITICIFHFAFLFTRNILDFV